MRVKWSINLSRLLQGHDGQHQDAVRQVIETLLGTIELDAGFKGFYSWAKGNNIPVIILSSGMQPIIRASLVHLIGKEAEEMQIISSDVAPRDGKSINEEGGWQIVFQDDSPFGHDKSLEIRKYSSLPDNERPTLFYAGDGASDLSAAKEIDLLFAKKGQGESGHSANHCINDIIHEHCIIRNTDLIQYCIRGNIPFIEFEDWSGILSIIKDIVSGRANVKQVAAAGAREARGVGSRRAEMSAIGIIHLLEIIITFYISTVTIDDDR